MKKYVPEEIDISKLINDNQMKSIKNFHSDKLKWILSEITEKPVTSTGFVEIHSKRFQDYIHNYKDYLEQLATDGIIERDLSFSHELVKKVRGYRFSKQHSSSIRGLEINYLPIVKKAAREKEDKLRSCQRNKHLVRWFNPSLTIDYDLAVDYLGAYYSEKKKEQELLAQNEQIIRNSWYENYSEKLIALRHCKQKNPYDSYKRAFIAVDKIKDHEYCLSTDSTVNRFYSIITLMPSDFRNFLRYDGHKLVCLDIRNSQAFFSLNLFNDKTFEEITKVAEEIYKKESYLLKFRSFLKC